VRKIKIEFKADEEEIMAALIAKVKNNFLSDYLKFSKLVFNLIFAGMLFSVLLIATA
jgi:hypothetical protein